jgi:hypothetical protein
VLNAEAHVFEVALQPKERPEFALTNSQGPFQKYEKLIPKFPFCQPALDLFG